MNRANGPDAVARRSSWESIVVSAGSRPVLVGTLRVAVSATLLTGLLALGLLTSVSTVTAAPVLEASTPAGPAVATLLPAPSFPDLDVPQVPLPEAEPEPVAYTCEPWADARMDDPAHPNHITNKNCPDLIAAKERAQREYRDSFLAEDHVVGDEREYTCSDPTSDVYGTAACGSDLDADGVIDGTAGSIGG